MANKKKNTQKSTQKSTTKTNYGARNKKKAPVKKEHGVLLTIVLVIMAVHGLFSGYLYYITAQEANRPWVMGLMAVHFLANVAAAIGIFYWKRWGLYVYAASTILAVVAGLLSVGIWSLFYMLLPFVILGWLIRSKQSYFD